jgi:hypothetical protein
LTCELCGEQFTPEKHNHTRQRFCSNVCRFKWHKQVDPVGAERYRQAQRGYWHQADGGYIRRRKRMLAEQRREILRLLEEAR